jgi:hypothetical protein
MTPEQEIEYQNMKLTLKQYKEKAEILDKLCKELVKIIPDGYLIKYLNSKKSIKKEYKE